MKKLFYLVHHSTYNFAKGIDPRGHNEFFLFNREVDEPCSDLEQVISGLGMKLMGNLKFLGSHNDICVGISLVILERTVQSHYFGTQSPLLFSVIFL